MTVKVGFVVTAAGLSRRHPPNKLLLKTGGQTVIRRTVSTLKLFPYPVVVVLGHQSGALREALQSVDLQRLKLVENPAYRNGLATSIRTGIQSLPENLDYFGFIPGDKPFIPARVINTLIAFLERNRPKLLIPEYHGQPGHPTFFSIDWRAKLLALTGDTGGREILQRHPKDIHRLAFDEKGIILDMDAFLEQIHAN